MVDFSQIMDDEMQELAEALRTGEFNDDEDTSGEDSDEVYCEDCDEYGHDCTGEEPEVNDDFPMYLEYDDDNFYDYDISRMDDY